MFRIKIESKENSVILALERYRDAIPVAAKETAEYARDLIVSRVSRGQLTDGSYRESKNPYKSRYARAQYYKRKKAGHSVKLHTLKYSGEFLRNFVIKSISRSNGRIEYGLGFIGYKGRISNQELMEYHEENSGEGFALSASQTARVMRYFNDRIRFYTTKL